MFITISDILTLRDTKNNRERSFVSFVIYRGDVEQKKASQLFVTFLGGWKKEYVLLDFLQIHRSRLIKD